MQNRVNAAAEDRFAVDVSRVVSLVHAIATYIEDLIDVASACL